MSKSFCNSFRINLTLEFEIPKDKITINSLLYTVAKNSSRILIEVAKALLSGIEEKAIKEKLEDSPSYRLNGHQSSERQIKASFGAFGYRFAQLYDPDNNKVSFPLKEKLQWPDYRQYMNESIQGSAGLLSHISYRQSVKESKRMLGTELSTTTFHRMIQILSERYGEWPKQKDVPYRFIMADGTKVRLQDGKGKSLGKGEMRWVMASVGEGQSFAPLGFWINQGWEKIRDELKELIDYEKLEILFADGEREIQVLLLLEENMRLQRCVFHGKKEFAHKLYLDGFKKKAQENLKRRMSSIPLFGIKKAALEKVKAKDKPKIEKLINKSREGLEDVLKLLDPEIYPNARAYLTNLKENIFTFFEYWLETEEWIDLTTNAIEGAFSRVKNRIWSIGKRWTERGLLNWLRIIVQKIFKPDLWQRTWEEYLKINPSFELTSLEVSYQWL